MSETGDLYAGVVGQDQAIAALTAAAVRPVHAYLLVGPPGTGKAAAARGFAAALVCPAAASGGPPDGTCDSCRRALAGLHPDVVEVEREGAAISIDTAREVTRLASTSPLEGARKVLVLHDFHLVKEAGPALLKTIEEPPASTVFVILAEYVPPELITIASRSVRIDFDPLTPAEVAGALEARGVEPDRAAELAAASGGRLDRALLLATDQGFKARREAWQAIPGRLDGTGATAAALADDLVRLLDSSVEPLRAQHEAERTALEERNARAVEVTGRGGGRAGGRAVKALLNSGISELETRQRREIRRQRTDELRAGLATLAGAYRDRLVADASPPDGASAGPGLRSAPGSELSPGRAPAPQSAPGSELSPGRAPAPQSGPELSPGRAPAPQSEPGSELSPGRAPGPRSGPASEAATARRRRATLRALDCIDKLGRDLQYNPGELLQLQALLMRLGAADGWEPPKP